MVKLVMLKQQKQPPMLIEKPPFPFEDFKAVMACWFPCEHEKREHRSWLTATKQWRVYEQCVDCGKLFRRGISFSMILPRLPKQLPPCDFEAARLFEQSYYGTSGMLAAHYNRYRKTSWWTQYIGSARLEKRYSCIHPAHQKSF